MSSLDPEWRQYTYIHSTVYLCLRWSRHYGSSFGDGQLNDYSWIAILSIYRNSSLVEHRVQSRLRCSKHCCIWLRYFSINLCNVLFWRVLFLSCVDFPFVYVLLKLCLIVLYTWFIISLYVLFRRFTKQTRLLGSNKILIDLISLNFIGSMHGENFWGKFYIII